LPEGGAQAEACGSIAGERLARRSPPAALRRGFALLILLLGAAILAKNLSLLL